MGTVDVTIESGCGLVTLNAPERLNAWDRAMQRQVARAVTDLDADPDVRAVVVTGRGDQAFCAGQDLHEVAEFTVDDVDDWLDGFASLYDVILSAGKPVVAALNGVAAGSGYQLALVCDVRVAHQGVRLGQPEVKSGIPSITGLYLTWQSLGHSRTTDLMLSGRLLDAAEAHQVGLVHQLVPRHQVQSAAVEAGMRLAEQPPQAFRMTKQRIHALLRDGLADAFATARKIDREAYGSGEPQRTARQFLAERTDPAEVSA